MAAILLTSTAALPAFEANGEQLTAIETMGRLNGIALQCRYLRQTKRIKTGLIETLPKQRQLGMLFEEVTNASFLDSAKDDAGCPGEEEISRQIDTALDALKSAFED